MKTIMNEADIAAALKVYRKWDSSGRQVRAWSFPAGARFGGEWAFYVQPSVGEDSLAEEADEVVDLREVGLLRERVARQIV